MTSNDILTIALLAASVWFLGSLYYQLAIRPFILDIARFGMFSVRDKLRAAALAGRVDEETFAYKFLERMLNNMVHFCAWFSMSALIEYKLTDDGAVPEQIRRFEAEAPQLLKTLEKEAIRKARTALLGNSPFWAAVGWLLFAFSSLKAIKKRYMYSHSRQFWHDESAARCT